MRGESSGKTNMAGTYSNPQKGSPQTKIYHSMLSKEEKVWDGGILWEYIAKSSDMWKENH